MTFRLKLLGGVSIEGPDGPVSGPAAQRLRLAILALLSTARDGTMSRDKVVAYLWPEADAQRARQNLAVAVHALRGTLGEDALVTAGDALRLERRVVTSDVAEFESAAAAAAGDGQALEQAAALYGGPFLDGFHVGSAPPELEEWIYAERERLRLRYAGVLERAAEARAARGDERGAVEAWRQLVALEPLAARGTLGLMRALARAGDRAGALRHAEEHEALLRGELGAPPEPAVAALVARLRAEAASPPKRSSLAMARSAEEVPGPAPSRVYAEVLRRALGGRYAVERQLGRGGVAAPYAATALGNGARGRPVVLHVFEPAVAAAADAGALLAGLERARALAHPNLVPIVDAGESEGVIYYAVPAVAGETLRDRMKRERQLPVDDALRLAREMAGALAHAHERGVLHRDVRPKHVLLPGGGAGGAGGPSLLANAGIASAVIAAAGPRATQSGVIVGAPAYMSPELLAGDADAVDARGDLYALACVLFEMLTGEPPLAGRSPQAVAAHRLHAAAPGVRTLRDSVPAEVERALARALARSPADRFRTVAEFRDALGG